jgi:periplasmic divalent cation tolerance protein
MAFTPRIVWVTAPTVPQARTLAHLILEKHLAACVNLVPGLESHYWWEGRLEIAAEVLLVIKSSAEQFERLHDLIDLHHSYSCPEVIALDPQAIAPTYRIWWEENCQGQP